MRFGSDVAATSQSLDVNGPLFAPRSYRHPVRYLYFKDNLLTTANIPNIKFPLMEPFEEVDNIKHRRYACISIVLMKTFAETWNNNLGTQNFSNSQICCTPKVMATRPQYTRAISRH